MADIDQIKSKLDIVEIVSEKVTLRKSGRTYKANCPFHNEKTPSFIVDPQRQTWRCFGACTTGGDIFAFVMKSDNSEFSDALRILAERAGVELSLGQPNSHSNDFYSINKLAEEFFQELLLKDEGKLALNYLDERKVNQKSREKFSLGYSSKTSDSLKHHLAFHDVELDLAVDCGLLRKTDQGSIYDFFRGRLMYPIHDRRGRTVGFGARTLDESGPKYINTPATQVFDKRSTLYGLHIAHDSIREREEVVIVEGYMDVIAAHEHGFPNVIASMGTALTSEQDAQLRTSASSYVLALDHDQAGMEATIRSLETAWKLFDRNQRNRRSDQLFAPNPFNIRVLALPSGKDPDEFIRTSPENWENVVQKALPVLDFLVPIVVENFDLNVPKGKAKVIESLYPLLIGLDPFDKDRYLRLIADAIQSDEKLVEQMLTSLTRQKGASFRNKQYAPNHQMYGDVNFESDEPDRDEYTFAESQTLFLIFSKPQLREIGLTINRECFRRPDDRELFLKWSKYDSKNMNSFVDNLDHYLKDRYHVVMSKAFQSSVDIDSETDLKSCIVRIERRRLFEYRDGLISSQSTDTPPSDDLKNELTDVDKRIRETFDVPRIMI